KSLRANQLYIEDQENLGERYLDGDSLKGTVLVGALVKPGWSTTVDGDGLFVAQIAGVCSGRMSVDNPGSRLQWDRVSGQAQFSMGGQGPQGTLVVGGEASRSQPLGRLTAES